MTLFDFPPRKDRSVKIDGEDELRCPDCGGDYLHQTTLRAINRSREDGPGTVTIVSGDGSSTLRSATQDELVGRRDALQIMFWCEACGEDAPEKVMQIKQHKGNTEITWVHPPFVKISEPPLPGN